MRRWLVYGERSGVSTEVDVTANTRDEAAARAVELMRERGETDFQVVDVREVDPGEGDDAMFEFVD